MPLNRTDVGDDVVPSTNALSTASNSNETHTTELPQTKEKSLEINQDSKTENDLKISPSIPNQAPSSSSEPVDIQSPHSISFKTGTFFLKTPKNLFIDFYEEHEQQHPQNPRKSSKNEYLYVDVSSTSTSLSTSATSPIPTTSPINPTDDININPMSKNVTSQNFELVLKNFTGRCHNNSNF